MDEKKPAISSPEAPVGAARMSSVEIKIVGESGELLKSFAGKVDVLIQQNIVGSCSVSFRDGECCPRVSACLVQLPRLVYRYASKL